MDAATRARLVRLRLMLEEAQARSQDRSPVGRHVALVLLDGACEYAMGLAAAQLDLRPRERFPARFGQLKEFLGDRWQAEGWTGVSDMHAARNQAQHRGIAVDPDELPRWVAEAERFVLSLVACVFEVELHEVLLAEAVETEAVRQHLVAAERALVPGDGPTAFAAAMAAFDEARARWRQQRSEALGELTLYAAPLAGLRQDAVNRALARIEDIAEVQPFAFDLGEYVWLAARRGEVESGIAPSEDEARRAVLFVLYWVLRWEAFAARYTERRWPEARPHEPPETGRPSGRPVVWDVKVAAEPDALHTVVGGLEPTFTVRIQLADVPKEERGRWVEELARALNESLPKRADGRAADFPRVGEDGIVRLFQVPPERTADEIVERVERALDEAHERYEEAMRRTRMWRARGPSLLAPYEAALKAVEFEGRPLVGKLSAEGDEISFEATAELLIEADPSLENDFWQAFARLGGGPSSEFDYRERALVFRNSVAPHKIAHIAKRAAEAVSAERAARAERAKQIEQMSHQLEGDLSERLRG